MSVAFVEEENCLFTNKLTTVVPIMGGGKRLGSLLLARFAEALTEDLILAGNWCYRCLVWKSCGPGPKKLKKRLEIKQLSSWLLARFPILNWKRWSIFFEELDGEEGLLCLPVTIADQLGITRSVIVNALRKFESAGVIESRSLGMKGTYIKVLNPYLLEQLSRKKKPFQK